jgi:hypothetical protein
MTPFLNVTTTIATARKLAAAGIMPPVWCLGFAAIAR